MILKSYGTGYFVASNMGRRWYPLVVQIAAMPQSWSQQQLSAGILRAYQIHQEATTTMMLTMAIIK
jgi:hypothetical protein